MSSSTSLVAVLAGAPTVAALQNIPYAVTMLEARDLPPDVSPSWLRHRFPRELLYTLPRRTQPLMFRRQALIQAARDYDIVGLEADSDLSPEVLAAIPAQKRLICWQGPCGDLAYLRSVFQRISSVPARMYSMVIKGACLKDGVRPLLLLKELRRTDLIAICEGKAGFWTRILAPYFGAPLVMGRLDPGALPDSGEPSVPQLIEDYGFPKLHSLRQVYGIVGNRVFQSPSPRLHNAGYRSLHHPALFLPFHVESFQDFWREMIEASALEPLDLGIYGVTIVSPYKEAAFAAAGLRSPMACRAAASNIFVRRDASWEAHTTDPESVARISENDHKQAEPLKAAVVGCGGAGRAIAAALQQAGADVTLVNRGHERGELAVRLLGLPFVPLSDFQPVGFSLVVNATPVGRDDDCMPFELDGFGPGALVVDLAYGTRPTPLVTAVAARGGAVIDGYDVLLNQVRKQFFLMTSREMPATIGRQTAASHTFNNFRHETGLRATQEVRLPTYRVTNLPSS